MKITLLAITVLIAFASTGQKFTAHLTNEKSMLFVDYQFVGKGKEINVDKKEMFGTNGFHTIVVITPGYLDESFMLRKNSHGKSYNESYTFLNHRVVTKWETEKSKLDVSHVKLSNALNGYKTYALEDSDSLELEIENAANQGKTLENGANFSAIQFDSDDAESNEKILYQSFESSMNELLKWQSDSTINVLGSNYRNEISFDGVALSFSAFTRSKGKNQLTYYRLEVTWYVRNSYGELLDSMIVKNNIGPYVPVTYNRIYAAYECKYALSRALAENFYVLQQTEFFQKQVSELQTQDEYPTVLEIPKPETIVQNLEDAELAAVIVKSISGFGSGFAISNNGYVLTNYHVVSPIESDSIVTLVCDGKDVQSKIVRVDRVNDVALLKADLHFEKCFKVNSDHPSLKHKEVYTIGVPKSIDLGKTLTLGMISNERLIKGLDPILQLSMSVNFGNSGGPVFDKEGRLYGIIVSKLVGSSTEGIGFAYPTYNLFKTIKINYL